MAVRPSLKDSLPVAGGQAVVLAAALLTAGPLVRLSAQVATNRAAFYLHPTDVTDARALWVNPAGIGVLHDASVHLDLTVRDPGPDGRLGQVTAGFSSRGLGFSYQRDALDGGGVAHTYRLGFAASAGGFAAGLAAALYRGDAKATGWDIGAIYTLHPDVTVGGLVANVGEPEVRGVNLPLTAIPGATVAPLGPRLALSAHALVTRDSVSGYAFGIRLTGPLRVPVIAVVRLDTDRALHRQAFAVGLSFGIQDVVGAVVTASGDLHDVDAASLYGVASRPLGP